MDQGVLNIETKGATEPAKHMFTTQTDHNKELVTIKAIAGRRFYFNRANFGVQMAPSCTPGSVGPAS